MKLGKAVVKGRVLILVVALLLLIPSVFGMIFTRVNYDMLNYLPDTLDTVKGQKYMLEDFGKGAFSFLIFEDMDDRQISAVADEIKEVDHVADVLAYSDVTPTATRWWRCSLTPPAPRTRRWTLSEKSAR